MDKTEWKKAGNHPAWDFAGKNRGLYVSGVPPEVYEAVRENFKFPF